MRYNYFLVISAAAQAAIKAKKSNSFPQKIRIPQPACRLGISMLAWQANGTFTYNERRTPPEGEVLRSFISFEQTSLVKPGF